MTAMTMKKAPTHNVRLVHGMALWPEPIYTKYPLAWFVGRCAKIAFQSAESVPEHMWVEIKCVDGDELVGFLTNEPEFVTHVAVGDQVSLLRTQIEAVKLSEREWFEQFEEIVSCGGYTLNRLTASEMGHVKKAFAAGLTPRQALEPWRRPWPRRDIE